MHGSLKQNTNYSGCFAGDTDDAHQAKLNHAEKTMKERAETACAERRSAVSRYLAEQHERAVTAFMKSR